MSNDHMSFYVIICKVTDNDRSPCFDQFRNIFQKIDLRESDKFVWPLGDGVNALSDIQYAYDTNAPFHSMQSSYLVAVVRNLSGVWGVICLITWYVRSSSVFVAIWDSPDCPAIVAAVICETAALRVSRAVTRLTVVCPLSGEFWSSCPS